MFKMLPVLEGEPQVYAMLNEDGGYSQTCTAEYPDFKDWVAEGNTPLPADDQGVSA